MAIMGLQKLGGENHCWTVSFIAILAACLHFGNHRARRFPRTSGQSLVEAGDSHRQH
jgi:hypothetical protein